MERPFDFTDERKWNVDRLIERLASLGDHKKKNKLSEARCAQISREMAHIAFEHDMRIEDAHRRKQEIEELEFIYDTHTSQIREPGGIKDE